MRKRTCRICKQLIFKDYARKCFLHEEFNFVKKDKPSFFEKIWRKKLG